MSLFHSIFSQSNHKRQIWLKFLHLLPDLLSNGYYLVHGSIFEIFISSDDAPKTFLDKLLSCIGIDLIELIVHPYIYICVPSVDDGPEGVIRGKFFGDDGKSLVVSLITSKEHFS